jgi:hypothetical protein
VSEVSNEKAMQERLFALKPDAFATSFGVGENSRVVHT